MYYFSSPTAPPQSWLNSAAPQRQNALQLRQLASGLCPTIKSNGSLPRSIAVSINRHSFLVSENKLFRSSIYKYKTHFIFTQTLAELC